MTLVFLDFFREMGTNKKYLISQTSLSIVLCSALKCISLCKSAFGDLLSPKKKSGRPLVSHFYLDHFFLLSPLFQFCPILMLLPEVRSQCGVTFFKSTLSGYLPQFMVAGFLLPLQAWQLIHCPHLPLGWAKFSQVQL